ncbi:MAG: AAA family ATPase, partial [Candidatus Hatepunaea meridiana]|nr:AAA family ATPase [Candidatus Hatepunaea meridiana]
MSTSHNIKSIQVEGGFLTGSKIVFDDRLNCLIGGRGTGKTTVLELIRYALGFTPDSRIEPVKARELNKLISANLGDANAVTLEIETLNGLKYTVKRKGGDEPPVIKDDAGNIKQIDFRKSQLFDAEIYSQNDIENAASNPRDQLNIVDRFREDDLNDIAKELSVLKRELEDNAIAVLSMMSQSVSLQDDISEIDGVSEKLKAFDIEAGENPEEVSLQGAKIQAVAKEQKAIGNLLTGLSDSEDELSSWLQDLERLIDTAFTSSNLSGPNRNQIEELRRSFKSALPELRQQLQSVLDAISSLRQDSDQTGQKIENQILTLQEEYDQTLARHQEVKGKVQERDKLQKLYDELLAKQTDYEEKRDREAQLIKERHQLIEKMSDLCDRRCNVRKEIADSINKQLSPMIRVTIVPMGNPEEYQSQLSEAMRHSQMQYAKVVERIVMRIPPPEFAKLVQNGQVEALMEKLEIDQERAN